MAELTTEDAKLNIPQHIKYWQRCLKSLLPTVYTSTDSSRITLGFFILASLDLLNAGPDTFPPSQRTQIYNWILKCQHPHGGFCGSPNHKYPEEYYGDEGEEGMEPANLAATYFAILSLSFVGGLEGVRRERCLNWLRRLQREDGSFGEWVDREGKIMGGYDMRLCYVLSCVRWMLRGDVEGDLEGIEDVDVEGLVGHLRNGQTYDGGISESSSHEAHAGYTYCAVASLSFLNRLPGSKQSSSADSTPNSNLLPGITNLPATIRWLISRQVGYQENENSDEEEEEEEQELPLKDQRDAMAGIFSDPAIIPDSEFVGFNGRCNKKVDTCYSFWVTASLDILGQKPHLVNTPAIRRFLFKQTQHRIGGFGKYPGSPPDIYHSFMGLAALAVMKEEGLKEFDSALAVSKLQRGIFERLRGEASKGGWRGKEDGEAR